MVAHKVAPALAVGQHRGHQAAAGDAAQRRRCSRRSCSTPACRPAHLNLVHGRGSEVGGWLVEQPRHRVLHLHRQHAGRQAASAAPSACGRSRSSSAASPRPSSATTPTSTAPRRAACSRRSAARARRARRPSGCSSQRSVLDEFLPRLLAGGARAEGRRSARPRDTMIGPMISERDAVARRGLGRRGRRAGRARCCSAARATGALLQPTILTDVDARDARDVRGDLRAGAVDHPVRRLRRRDRRR